MTDNNRERINQLMEKLEILLKKQDDFSQEINILRNEIHGLSIEEDQASTEKEEIETKAEQAVPAVEKVVEPVVETPQKQTSPPVKAPQKEKSDLEKFIGENLINKIGIAITVIGVAIGAKYSIENELISPLTRIILGYLTGLGLLGVGIRLKKKYENYSAVLVSGAMAIMYFITFSAYSFYNLIPITMAFGLMVVFTAFTVVAAIHYNRQVIAHIGLVGAYAVPFLLSDGSGNIEVLFTYMAIINVGILVIAFKKYWKPLYYAAFGLTWLIYLAWHVADYKGSEHFGLALLFLTVFFITFYVMFLAFKLLQEEKFQVGDILLLLLNSFIFYGIGYIMLDGHETGNQLLGVFTLANAIVHFSVSALIYRKKLADKQLFYMVAGLVLVFITIAIPVQLDGNWVTLLWAGEAALLFWIGRSKKVAIYEYLAYPLMALALFSIVHDWFTVYDGYYPERPETRLTPLLNINFLTTVLFIAAFGFMYWCDRNKDYNSDTAPRNGFENLVSYLVPAILVFVSYFGLRLEIGNYWDQLYTDSMLTVTPEGQEYPSNFWNYDLRDFKRIWILNYSLLFFSLLGVLNIKKLKSRLLGYINLGLLAICLLVFLTQGLYVLSELRESYIDQYLAQYFEKGPFNIWIRYISLTFVAFALWICHQYARKNFFKRDYVMAFDFLLHTCLLWIASSELLHWADMADAARSYKLVLSILWGLYALFLIVLGIWKRKKYLRVAAISWFGITLLKLFFYDISHLDTIPKTIVFVSLGVLLLIISFLYNKYKQDIK
nr:DUF2339 domain-containing protein [Allomuricauda sp.]